MSIRPIDLRDILEYVPRFRNHIFVICVDGSVIAHENFVSLVTDMAVLQSLNIKMVLCHGIAHQIRELSETKGIPYSNDRGEGPTDDATLQLAIEANGIATSQIMRELSAKRMPFSFSNCVTARPIGIDEGINQQHTATCDGIDKERIQQMLKQGDIPVFSPIIYDDKGRSLRVNSDHIAATLATELEASKLIYLTSRPQLIIDHERIQNCSVDDIKDLIQSNASKIDSLLLSKAKHAIKVLEGKTNRVHVLDGRIDGCLLIEIFDKVGLGTMIHSNEYDQIRQAEKDDLVAVAALIKQASKTAHLLDRSLEEVKEQLENFYVYEVDNSIIGCTSLINHGNGVAELASVCVQTYHQAKGIGKKLAQYTLEQARKQNFKKVVTLSTQASEFFTEQLGFRVGAESDLPEDRRHSYEASRRNSVVLVREG